MRAARVGHGERPDERNQREQQRDGNPPSTGQDTHPGPRRRRRRGAQRGMEVTDRDAQSEPHRRSENDGEKQRIADGERQVDVGASLEVIPDAHRAHQSDDDDQCVGTGQSAAKRQAASDGHGPGQFDCHEDGVVSRVLRGMRPEGREQLDTDEGHDGDLRRGHHPAPAGFFDLPGLTLAVQIFFGRVDQFAQALPARSRGRLGDLGPGRIEVGVARAPAGRKRSHRDDDQRDHRAEMMRQRLDRHAAEGRELVVQGHDLDDRPEDRVGSPRAHGGRIALRGGDEPTARAENEDNQEDGQPGCGRVRHHGSSVRSAIGRVLCQVHA